jgi:3-hydroxyisobutyrate dehydrogenase
MRLFIKASRARRAMGRLDDGHSISNRGFIGLGTMGEAMALTLVNAGSRLLVWNRTPAKSEILAAAGADVAPEAADVFAHSATVFLMLVDGGAINTVLDRGGTGFAARVSGRTVVHMGIDLAGLFA